VTGRKRLVLDWLGEGKEEVSLRVDRGEELTYVLVGAGEGGTRTIEIDLAAPGAKALILGVLVGREGKVSIHSRQRHRAPETESDLLIKSVLFDQASLDYEGLIRIEKKAQRSNAYQRNDNLILGKGARVETKPELEILADDVRCGHGATIGGINEDVWFYLVSRGIDGRRAAALFLEGFFTPVLERLAGLADAEMMRKIKQTLNRSLNQLSTEWKI
jgi:Fe-S cluster assembly protein SufD